MTVFGGFITGGTVSTDPGDATKLNFSGIVINGALGAVAGDTFSAGGYQVPIASIDGTGAATLVYAFPVALDDEADYAIARDSAERYNPAATNLLVRQYFSRVGDPGITYTVPDNADGPDEQIISDPQEGQKAIRYLPLPWTTWLYTEGAWVEQPGSPGGPGPQGEAGATWLAQDAEPTTDYPPNSLWVDTDSAGLDVYELSGSPLNWVSLGFGLKGPQGGDSTVPGPQGPIGPAFEPDEVVPDLAGRDAYDDEAKNFAVLVESDSSNSNEPTLYFKLSAVSADWSAGFTFAGGGGSGDVAGETHAADSKAVPDDADEFGFADSGASWGWKKFTWANLKATLASWLVSAGWIREALSANRTYYVDTINGSDSNNGLAAGSGNAFKTIQKAIDTVAGLDLSIYNVTIQVGAGTYTGGVIVNGPWIGAGTVTLVGDVTTPSNVVISTTSADAIKLQNGARLAIGGFKLQTTTSGCGILSTSGAAASVVGKMEYGACDTAHLRADGSGSNIAISSPYSISGGANAHYMAGLASTINASSLGVVTVSGTPNFNYAFVYIEFSYVRAFGNTYSGSATGSRYSVNANGAIQTAGAGENYFPGNSNGTKATGGQYL